MSSLMIWTYIGYGIAALFLLASLGFGLMIFISSQTAKSNPIALPVKQSVKKDENEDKGLFENDRLVQKPTGRRSAPIMHEPLRKSSSTNFFDDDDDFSITTGSGK